MVIVRPLAALLARAAWLHVAMCPMAQQVVAWAAAPGANTRGTLGQRVSDALQLGRLLLPIWEAMPINHQLAAAIRHSHHSGTPQFAGPWHLDQLPHSWVCARPTSTNTAAPAGNSDNPTPWHWHGPQTATHAKVPLATTMAQQGGHPTTPFFFQRFGHMATLGKQSARLYWPCQCSALLLHVCQMGHLLLHMLQWHTQCACSCDHYHAMPCHCSH